MNLILIPIAEHPEARGLNGAPFGFKTSTTGAHRFELKVGHHERDRDDLYGLAYDLNGRLQALEHYPITGLVNIRSDGPSLEGALQVYAREHEDFMLACRKINRGLQKMERLIRVLGQNPNVHVYSSSCRYRVISVWPENSMKAQLQVA